MSTVITIEKLGSTVESVNMLTFTRTDLKLVDSNISADGLQRSADYILAAGSVDADLKVSVRINSDKPTANKPKHRYSVRLIATTRATDSVSGEVLSEDDSECVIAFNLPQSIGFDITEVRQLLANAYSLTYGSVSAGAPATDLLTKLAYNIQTLF